MSLYKRKDSAHWWIKLSHRGRRVQQSAGTADADKAQEYHDKLKAALWDEARLGIKPQRSWKEAVLKYVGETSHKASHADDLLHFRYLDRFLGALMLSEVDRAVLDRVTAAKQREGVANASVNRMLGVVQRVLRRAVNEWEWLNRCPKVRMLPEPSIRIRWLKPEEAAQLLQELPEHLRAMARFSLETGLRRANVVGLRWENVDLVRRRVIVHADEAKGRRSLPVPLTDAAVEVIRSQIGKDLRYVFTYLAKPVFQVNGKAWKRALERAGIKDFRWHDLRHTWATWHVLNGTSLHELKELGGWQSLEMVLRYAHLVDNAHLAGVVKRFSGLRLLDGGQRSYETATLA